MKLESKEIFKHFKSYFDVFKIQVENIFKDDFSACISEIIYKFLEKKEKYFTYVIKTKEEKLENKIELLLKTTTSLAKKVALLEQSTEPLDLIKELESVKKTVRKVGRPKKVETLKTTIKRKVGRPRKEFKNGK